MYRFKRWLLTKLCRRWQIYPSPSMKVDLSLSTTERPVVTVRVRVPVLFYQYEYPHPLRVLQAMKEDRKHHALQMLVRELEKNSLVEFENVGSRPHDENLEATLRVVKP